MNNPEQKSNWFLDLLELGVELVCGFFSILGSIIGFVWDIFIAIIEGILSIIAAILD